jgi:hypothetical protein
LRQLGFPLVHYSVQGNHVHLLVEANDEKALSKGMNGLGTRIARRLNRVMGRKGKVLDDRYHGHILRTPTEHGPGPIHVDDRADRARHVLDAAPLLADGRLARAHLIT